MSIYFTVLVFLISFLTTVYIIPKWINRAKKAGLVGRDVHKNNDEKIAEVGGLPVICGFLFSCLVFIGILVFIINIPNDLVVILALICSLLIATLIGLVDDILGWKIGLRQRHKILLTLAIPIPIMVVNAGVSVMNLPFLGIINLGLLYPFIIIPLTIIGSSNGFNMLAGYNGLESGMGIIIITTLSYILFLNGSTNLGIVGICMVAALIAFLIFNLYHARIFPGDTLTYSVGAMIGIFAIVGNVEKFAFILFIPYFIQFLLKARGKMKKESFGKTLQDGSLINRYKKIYGIEHIAIRTIKRIKGRAYENEVVIFLLSFQTIIAILVIISF